MTNDMNHQEEDINLFYGYEYIEAPASLDDALNNLEFRLEELNEKTSPEAIALEEIAKFTPEAERSLEVRTLFLYKEDWGSKKLAHYRDLVKLADWLLSDEGQLISLTADELEEAGVSSIEEAKAFNNAWLLIAPEPQDFSHEKNLGVRNCLLAFGQQTSWCHTPAEMRTVLNGPHLPVGLAKGSRILFEDYSPRQYEIWLGRNRENLSPAIKGWEKSLLFWPSVAETVGKMPTKQQEIAVEVVEEMASDFEKSREPYSDQLHWLEDWSCFQNRLAIAFWDKMSQAMA